MELNTAEKIAAIEKSGYSLAWDGCHKIYLLGDQARIEDAVATDYDIYPAAEIRRIISASCGLVFVNNWGRNTGNWDEDRSTWDHDWAIGQCTEDIYDAAESVA